MAGKSKLFGAFFCTLCVGLLSLYYFGGFKTSGPFSKNVKLLPVRPYAVQGHSPDGIQDNTSSAFYRNISNRVQNDTLAPVKRHGSDTVQNDTLAHVKRHGSSRIRNDTLAPVKKNNRVQNDTLTPVKNNGAQVNPSAQTCLREVWVPMQRAQGQEQLGLPEDLTYMYEKKCVDYQQPANTKKKLILVFNRQDWWFSGNKNYANVFRGCPYDACQFTDDHNLLQQADAVLFFVCRLNSKTHPPRHSLEQIWIAFCLESPVHYSGFHDLEVWRDVFNWTMGYRVDSDVFYPYSELALRPGASWRNYTSIALAKTKPIAWFVSNCQTHGKREQYVTQLKKYINVDIFGGCSSQKCPRSTEGTCLEILNKTYYFYASFENSLCRDYVTEKFFKTFDIDVVPIVRGGANYSRYFPPGTFINTASYPSPKDLADYLRSLMANPQAYARLLETKDRFMAYPSRGGPVHLCELCKRLHTSGSQSKVYPDFMKWTRKNSCKQPSDV